MTKFLFTLPITTKNNNYTPRNQQNMSSSPSILAERDPNVALSPEKSKAGKDTTKSLEYHRQVLESRLKESKSVNTNTQSQPPSIDTGNIHKPTNAHLNRPDFRNSQTYISPSDNIMSPATAKLAAFKTKHVKR